MITRSQYLNGEATQREYYAQFVNDSVKNLVLLCVGAERIKNSTCPHLNDIPLVVWDRM